MATFKPRTTAPSYNSKFYKHTSAGGVNRCILISGGSVLPNCVGYAWGRAYEILGKAHNLPMCNAESWYPKNDGYTRGQKPKLGAIACWKKGVVGNEDDGAGHVAVVEEILSDGSIVTSNSAYNGTRFYMKTLKPPYSLGGTYAFQGFIYLPEEFENEPKKEEPEKTETKETVYTVQKGDTLGEIASKYGTTYQKIAAYNGIDNPHIIYIGQKIKIPSEGNSVPYTVYTVKSGDTLSEIAEKYGTTYQKLAEYNGIENPSLIYPNQQIKIPK